MFPDQFEYFTAESVEEALGLLQDHGDRDVELLAGGHSLIPTMKSGLASPDVLIDINNIDTLQGIDRDDDVTTLGALTRYADIAGSEAVRENVRLLGDAAGEIADMQVRNRGTIGGNIAHADPASDLPGATLAADATVTARGPDGERTIDIDDFFEGLYGTALDKEELLTRISVPNQANATGSAYVKKPHPGSGYAAVGVAVSLTASDETIESVRVAANGVVDHAVRLESVERTLQDETLDKSIVDEAADRADETLDDGDIMVDTYASSRLRRSLLREYTRAAIQTANERIQ